MRKKMNTGFLVAILSLTLLPLYQNCSNTFDFEKQSDFALTQGEAEIVEFNIAPNAWENRPKIDITVVVDNSNSMQPVQDKVAAALKRTLGPLSDFSGKIEVFTTTQIENQDGGDKASRVVDFLKSGETLSQRPTERPYTEKHQLPVSFTMSSDSHYSALDYQPSTLSSVSQLFGDSIANIGTNGSSNEEGLCSLLRVVEKKSQEGEGAFNAILLVSNENDHTDFSKCIKEIEHEVRSEIQTANRACSTDDHVSSHLSCKYQNSARWTQNAKLKKYVVKYANTKEDWVISGPRTGKSILKAKYNTRDVGITYKTKSYKRNLSVKGRIINDGIVSAEQMFQFNQHGLNSCEAINNACSSADMNLLTAKKFQINGRIVTLDAATCSASCTDDSLKSHTTRLASNSIGKCSQSNLVSEFGDKCNGKLNCEWTCVDKSKTSNFYGAQTETSHCEAKNSISQENFTHTLFNNLKISRYYFDNNADTLNQVKDRLALINASVSCYDGNQSYRQIVNNGTPSNSVSNLGYRSSLHPNYSYHIEEACSNAPEKLNAKFSGVSGTTCFVKRTNPVSTLSRNTSTPWDDVNSCNASALPEEIKSALPSGAIDRITDCSSSYYTKSEVATCVMEQTRENVCGAPDRVQKFLASCSTVSDKIDLEAEHSFTCGKVVVGNYQVSEVDIRNSSETKLFVPTGASSEISANMKDKLKNFQFASFAIPSSTDIPASSNNHPCFGNNPGAFSQGSSFENLVAELNQGESEPIAANFSICEDDYSPAIQTVVDRAIAQAEYSYRLSLDFNESIYKVFIVDGSGVSSFVPPDKYTFGNGLINFLDRSLIDDRTSSIKIEIWRDLLVQPDDLQANISEKNKRRRKRVRR